MRGPVLWIALAVAACGQPGGVTKDQDAGQLDADVLADGASPDGGEQPVRHGTVVLIGDSLMPCQAPPSQAQNGRPVLEFDGDTIVSVATGGLGTAAALAAWQASPYRGSSAVVAGILLIGINDIDGAGATGAQVRAGIDAIIADWNTNNPGATLIVSKLTPARGKLTPGEYTQWLAANVLLDAIGAKGDLLLTKAQGGLSDGNDALHVDLENDTHDHLHPNPRGTAVIAMWMREWLASTRATFGPTVTGVLIGDSVVAAMESTTGAHNGKPILDFYGDTVISQAGLGYTTTDALTAWQASAQRGSQDLGWVYIQAGVYDILAGRTGVQVRAGVDAIIADIARSNPGIRVVVGQLPPVRGALTSPQYTQWLAANTLLAVIGAKSEASTALSDGAGGLSGTYNTADYITPNARGAALNAMWVLSWVAHRSGGGKGYAGVKAKRMPWRRTRSESAGLKEARHVPTHSRGARARDLRGPAPARALAA